MPHSDAGATALPAVGQRIATTDGRLGTVKYVGSLSSATPTSPDASSSTAWIGIDWDNPADGKHNGSVRGVKYFETTYKFATVCSESANVWVLTGKCRTPTSGSFIKPANVAAPRTFLDAVYDRYFPEEDEQDGQDDPAAMVNAVKRHPQLQAPEIVGANRKGDEIIGTSWAKSSVSVELYGFRKVQRKQTYHPLLLHPQLDRLLELNLVGLHINTINRADELTQKNLINVTELDLSRNPIAEWSQVAEVGRAARQLRLLRLNYTRLQPLADSAGAQDAFPALQILSLNATKTPFAEVLRVITHLPALQELYLGFNGYTTLAAGSNTTQLPALQVISLEGNELDWDALQQLGIFPSLKALYAPENRISCITQPQGKCFAALEKLHLQNNRITQASDLDKLNALTNLKDLRINKNPFYDASADYSRLQTIGRLQHLANLNGSPIAKGERLSAEVYYLKSILDENVAKTGRIIDPSTPADKLPAELDAAVAAQHASTARLAAMHGVPMVAPPQDDRLVSQLMELTLVCMQSKKQGVSRVSKKVTPNMTVRMLKSFAARSFGLPKCKLVLRNAEGHEQEMDDDLKPVSYYEASPQDLVDQMSAAANRRTRSGRRGRPEPPPPPAPVVLPSPLPEAQRSLASAHNLSHGDTADDDSIDNATSIHRAKSLTHIARGQIVPVPAPPASVLSPKKKQEVGKSIVNLAKASKQSRLEREATVQAEKHIFVAPNSVQQPTPPPPPGPAAPQAKTRAEKYLLRKQERYNEILTQCQTRIHELHGKYSGDKVAAIQTAQQTAQTRHQDALQVLKDCEQDSFLCQTPFMSLVATLKSNLLAPNAEVVDLIDDAEQMCERLQAEMIAACQAELVALQQTLAGIGWHTNTSVAAECSDLLVEWNTRFLEAQVRDVEAVYAIKAQTVPQYRLYQSRMTLICDRWKPLRFNHLKQQSMEVLRIQNYPRWDELAAYMNKARNDISNDIVSFTKAVTVVPVDGLASSVVSEWRTLSHTVADKIGAYRASFTQFFENYRADIKQFVEDEIRQTAAAMAECEQMPKQDIKNHLRQCTRWNDLRYFEAKVAELISSEEAFLKELMQNYVVYMTHLFCTIWQHHYTEVDKIELSIKPKLEESYYVYNSDLDALELELAETVQSMKTVVDEISLGRYLETARDLLSSIENVFRSSTSSSVSILESYQDAIPHLIDAYRVRLHDFFAIVTAPPTGRPDARHEPKYRQITAGDTTYLAAERDSEDTVLRRIAEAVAQNDRHVKIAVDEMPRKKERKPLAVKDDRLRDAAEAIPAVNMADYTLGGLFSRLENERDQRVDALLKEISTVRLEVQQRFLQHFGAWKTDKIASTQMYVQDAIRASRNYINDALYQHEQRFGRIEKTVFEPRLLTLHETNESNRKEAMLYERTYKNLRTSFATALESCEAATQEALSKVVGMRDNSDGKITSAAELRKVEHQLVLLTDEHKATVQATYGKALQQWQSFLASVDLVKQNNPRCYDLCRFGDGLATATKDHTAKLEKMRRAVDDSARITKESWSSLSEDIRFSEDTDKMLRELRINASAELMRDTAASADFVRACQEFAQTWKVGASSPSQVWQMCADLNKLRWRFIVRAKEIGLSTAGSKGVTYDEVVQTADLETFRGLGIVTLQPVKLDEAGSAAASRTGGSAGRKPAKSASAAVESDKKERSKLAERSKISSSQLSLAAAKAMQRTVPKTSILEQVSAVVGRSIQALHAPCEVHLTKQVYTPQRVVKPIVGLDLLAFTMLLNSATTEVQQQLDEHVRQAHQTYSQHATALLRLLSEHIALDMQRTQAALGQSLQTAAAEGIASLDRWVQGDKVERDKQHAKLKPNMGHPNLVATLDKLDAEERDRRQAAEAQLKRCIVDSKEALRKWTVECIETCVWATASCMDVAREVCVVAVDEGNKALLTSLAATPIPALTLPALPFKVRAFTPPELTMRDAPVCRAVLDHATTMLAQLAGDLAARNDQLDARISQVKADSAEWTKYWTSSVSKISAMYN
ncbi:hypothetical protein RI367_004605 [Sorochytrium milnesiophthora]